MKNFTKKICAVITLVAMLTSLGISGFALEDNGAKIQITGYEWSDVTDGVITATVYYTVDETDGAIGDLGATMLTYAKGEATGDFTADKDGEYDEDDTPYADTMEIVGIDQGEPAYDEEAESYVVEFPVALNGAASAADDVKLDYGEDAVILIGGDNVTTPGALLLSVPWLVDSLGLTVDAEPSIPVTVNFDVAPEASELTEAVAEKVEEKVLEEFTAAEGARGITAKDSTETTSAALTFAGTENVLSVEVTECNVADNAYEATVEITVRGGYIDEYLVDDTQPAGGMIPEDGLSFNIEVGGSVGVVIPVWEVEEEQAFATTNLVLSEEDYALEGAELTTAVENALKAELGENLTLAVKKGEATSTATVAVTDDMVEVTEVSITGEGDEARKSYTATVTIPAGAYVVDGAAPTDKLNLATPVEIEISGAVTNYFVWEAGTPVLDGGTTINVEVDDIASGTLAADVKAAIAEALAGKKITFPVTKEGEDPTSVEVSFADTMLGDATVTGDADKTYTAKITVPAGKISEDPEVVLNAPVEIEISGAVTEIPVWEAGTPVLDGGTTINVKVDDIASGTLAADVKAAIAEDLAGKKITFPVTKEGEDPTSVEVSFADTMLGDATVTGDADKTYTAKITVPAGKISEDPEVVLNAPVEIEISGTVTKKFDYGDVDHSGLVDFDDAVQTAKYAVSGSVSGTFDLTLANVDGDDAGQNGITFDDAIEIAKKAVSSSHKFPIELPVEQ